MGELNELKRQIEGKNALATHNLLTSSPFSWDILDYQAPKSFKALDHLTYDGIDDPQDHLLSF